MEVMKSVWIRWAMQKVLILILVYLLTAISLTPGGRSTVHIYTQTIHRITQLTLVGMLSGIRIQSTQKWPILDSCNEEYFLNVFSSRQNLSVLDSAINCFW
jgi:uncharacterized integral membrane protein